MDMGISPMTYEATHFSRHYRHKQSIEIMDNMQ